jgi:hypothetical protein
VGKSAPFRLTRNELLLAVVSAAFAGEAGAAAGRVDFTTGGATVSGSDGRQRPLAKGTDLDSGDTIRTDAAGRAQIRFPDGAYISLQPNTEFSIKEYNFEGKTDGNERSFFSLAKGAMRTVTGLIGRVNKNRYQIATPTATIGIRGTGGIIQIGVDGSTVVTGTSGIWTITNPSGTIDVPAGSVGRAPAAPNQPPQQTTEKPSTGPVQPATTTIAISPAEQRSDSGASSVLTTATFIPLVTGTPYAIAAATNFSTFNAAQVIAASDNATAVFDSAGHLTDVTIPGANVNQITFSGTHSTPPEFGSDGIIAWGRWTGPIAVLCSECSSPGALGPNQGFHYAIGVPTAMMPTEGSAVYNLMGATNPTYGDGSTAPGTLTSAQLNVTFGATTSVAANLNVMMPDGRGYNATGSGTTTTNALSLFNMSMTTTGTGGACSCGCFTNANGFFAGTNAERAGLAYSINDSFAGKNIAGAAAFKKQ